MSFQTGVQGRPMSPDIVDESRLDECGCSSFDPGLFLDEPGRKHRDVSAFFLPLLKDFSPGKQILELCCGAGKLLITLARSGYEVTGIDLSTRMLAVCREVLASEDEAVRAIVRLIHDDMCTFDLGETFDFVIMEDECFGYLLTTEDQIACLRQVCQHLNDDGYLFLMFKTPYMDLGSGDYQYDPIRQIRSQKNTWSIVDEKDRTLERVTEGFERMKMTYPCELELLLEVAGLEAVHRWGDWKRNPFVDPASQEYHYLVRKATGSAPRPVG